MKSKIEKREKYARFLSLDERNNDRGSEESGFCDKFSEESEAKKKPSSKKRIKENLISLEDKNEEYYQTLGTNQIFDSPPGLSPSSLPIPKEMMAPSSNQQSEDQGILSEKPSPNLKAQRLKPCTEVKKKRNKVPKLSGISSIELNLRFKVVRLESWDIPFGIRFNEFLSRFKVSSSFKSPKKRIIGDIPAL